MSGLELLVLYRAVLIILGLVSAVVNLSALTMLVRHREKLGLVTRTGGIIGLATVVLTAGASMFWRVRDWNHGIPLNPGDFTALIPVVGFLVSGVFTLKETARAVGAWEAQERAAKGVTS